jgi:hypothetical protein
MKSGNVDAPRGEVDQFEHRPKINLTFRGVHPFAELAHYVQRRATSLVTGPISSASVLVTGAKRGQVAVYVIGFTADGPVTALACDGDPLLAARDAFDAVQARSKRRSRSFVIRPLASSSPVEESARAAS